MWAEDGITGVRLEVGIAVGGGLGMRDEPPMTVGKGDLEASIAMVVMVLARTIVGEVGQGRVKPVESGLGKA